MLFTKCLFPNSVVLQWEIHYKYAYKCFTADWSASWEVKWRIGAQLPGLDRGDISSSLSNQALPKGPLPWSDNDQQLYLKIRTPNWPLKLNPVIKVSFHPSAHRWAFEYNAQSKFSHVVAYIMNHSWNLPLYSYIIVTNRPQNNFQIWDPFASQKAWSGLSPTRNPVHLRLWGLSFPSVESQLESGGSLVRPKVRVL